MQNDKYLSLVLQTCTEKEVRVHLNFQFQQVQLSSTHLMLEPLSSLLFIFCLLFLLKFVQSYINELLMQHRLGINGNLSLSLQFLYDIPEKHLTAHTSLFMSLYLPRIYMYFAINQTMIFSRVSLRSLRAKYQASASPSLLGIPLLVKLTRSLPY